MEGALDDKTVTAPPDAIAPGTSHSILSSMKDDLSDAERSMSTTGKSITRPFGRDVSPVSQPPKPRKRGFFRIVKIVVIVAVLGFVIYKVHPILSAVMGLYSVFTSFGGSNKQFKQETKGLNTKKEKPKKPKTKGSSSGTASSSKQTIIPKKSSGVKYKTPPAIPAPDDSMSEIQHKASRPGSCYIGKWKGYRSCINVKDPRDCYSGEIYPSQEECVHPKTRV